MRQTLQAAFETKRWDSREEYSRSGAGSTLDATAQIRHALPGLFKQYEVGVFLDAPCGDWNWMQTVDLTGVHYIGGDISGELMQEVSKAHSGKDRDFVTLDVTHDALPDADLMMCRDCLFHLTWDMRWAFFETFAASNIRYLLLTMHHVARNADLAENGDFEKFNPCAAPFNLEPPIEMIHENKRTNLDPAFIATPRGSWQRSLGLWRHDQIVSAIEARAD